MNQKITTSLVFAFLILFSLTSFSMGRGGPITSGIDVSSLKDGDILFIQSQTSQAAALREATESVWTHVGILIKNKNGWQVAEAVGPLKYTPIADFIARSKNKAFEVYRFKFFDPATMKQSLLAELPKYNKPYDIYFEWSDDMIYCSELTYKVFKDVTGHEMGRIQKMKEMRLEGPYVQALIKKRLTDTGRELDPEEFILTPVSQMVDPNMQLVQKSN